MPDIEQHDSHAGCFLQLFRSLVGPTLILAFGLALIANQPPLGGPLDFIFAAVVLMTAVSVVLAPQPSSPSPADAARPASIRLRHLAILLAISLGIFAFAHFLAPRIF